MAKGVLGNDPFVRGAAARPPAPGASPEPAAAQGSPGSPEPKTRASRKSGGAPKPREVPPVTPEVAAAPSSAPVWTPVPLPPGEELAGLADATRGVLEA